MKKKAISRSLPARYSLSEGGFFNVRILIGLFVVLAGVFLALLGSRASSNAASGLAQGQTKYQPPIKIDPTVLPPGFDCSKIHELGIDKQDNMRAGLIMIACGLSEGGSPSNGSQFSGNGFYQWIRNLVPAPLFTGGSDVDVILPDGTYPHVTQSESMEWGGPNNTWVVNYNDSRTGGACYGGLSYSTDNGTTWHSTSALCSGHGTNFGDPVVVYNARLGMWFAGDLATGCGGQGIGLWSSPDGITWTTGACAHNGGSDDRESMWVDNNPASPYYGRMYVSYNDFNIGGGALYCTHSDDGVTWTTAQLNSGFIRDIQVTGDLQGSGRVYVATMDEGGGGLSTRQNVMYRSTNGGVSWTSVNVGPALQGPGRATSGYFALAFSTIWRHMGWGEPAANGNVVSLDWAACGSGGNTVCSSAADHGDIWFIRSTDAGLTWGTPVKLNTDTGTAMQWQPSLAATQNGALFASWYDEREVNGGADRNCTVGSSSQNCYRRWGRVSTDNGATWQADDMVGRALSPLPAQPDGAVQSTYEGDYDYHSANGNTFIGGWTDGRTIISGSSQQDVFVNFVQGGPSPTATATATASPTPTFTPTPTPCVAGSYTVTQIDGSIVPGTTDIGNHCDSCITNVALPFPYTLYDHTYTSVNLSSDGIAQFTTADNNSWHNYCLPWATHNSTIFPYWTDLYTVNSGYGIFISISGTAPNRIFNIEWRNQYYPGTGTANFELRLYEGQTRFDLIYGTLDNGNTSATAGAQRDDAISTQYFCNGSGGAAIGAQAYTLVPCGTPSPTPSASPTPTATATPTPCTLAAPNLQGATNITFGSFTAHWNSVSGATGYRLDVATTNNFTTYVPGYQNLDVGNVTSYPVTGLNAHTTYYYRVRAYNGCATSRNSNVKNVQTLACTPQAPSAQSATNITSSSFTAHWGSVNGATGYRLDVATINNFTTYVPGYDNLDVGNVTSYNVTGLNAHTTYYYRVRAYNGCATSPNSSVKSVTTSP